MRIKTKNAKKWRYVYCKFGIKERFNIKDTKAKRKIRQIRVMEVKKVIYGEAI